MSNDLVLISGLYKTAETLKHEVDIVPLVDSGQFSGGPPVYPARSMISFHPSQLNRRITTASSSSPAVARGSARPSVPRQLTINPARTASTAATPTSTRLSNTANTATPRPNVNTPLQIRVNRPSQSVTPAQCPTPATPVTRSAMKTISEAGDINTGKVIFRLFAMHILQC